MKINQNGTISKFWSLFFVNNEINIAYDTDIWPYYLLSVLFQLIDNPRKRDQIFSFFKICLVCAEKREPKYISLQAFIALIILSTPLLHLQYNSPPACKRLCHICLSLMSLDAWWWYY